MNSLNNFNKLNVGCSLDIKKNLINLNIASFPSVDVVHYVNGYPWPILVSRFQPEHN